MEDFGVRDLGEAECHFSLLSSAIGFEDGIGWPLKDYQNPPQATA